MLGIDPWCYYFAAVLMLVIPADWLFASYFAAVFHELCHIAAIKFMHDRIHSIQVHPWGIIIEASFVNDRNEILAALAGPMGSFSLLLTCHIFPKVALCALIQGMFNLLPVYPLDGGRALALLLKRFIPSTSHRYCIGFICATLIVFCMMKRKILYFGVFLIMVISRFLIRAFRGKIPCIDSENRVQ